MNLILNGEINTKPEFVSGKIVAGEAVNLLTQEQQNVYAIQISKELDKYPDLTKKRTAEELARDMRDARSILCLHPETDQLLAFAKLELFGINDAKQHIYEFGSWIGGNGCGRQVLEAGRDLSAEKFPYARLIAVVRSTNLKAQNIILESGGVKVGYVGEEMKHVYDITRRQQPAKIIKIGPGGVWTTERNKRHVI